LQQIDSNFNYSYSIRIRPNTTHPLFGTALVITEHLAKTNIQHWNCTCANNEEETGDS